MSCEKLICSAILAAILGGCNGSNMLSPETQSTSELDTNQDGKPELDQADFETNDTDETATLPVNINGAFLAECASSPASTESPATVSVECRLSDRDSGEKLAIEHAWQLSPNPDPQELLSFEENLDGTAPWHIRLTLTSQYFDERLDMIDVIISGEVQARIERSKIAQSISPDTESLDPSNGASMGGAISDETVALMHSAVDASQTGGTETWDRIYFDHTSGLYFTNVLSFTQTFASAEASCASLKSSGTLNLLSWRLATTTEIETLYGQGIAALEFFTAWFWSSESDEKNDSKAIAIAMGNGSMFSFPKTNGNMSYFCVSQ